MILMNLLNSKYILKSYKIAKLVQLNHQILFFYIEKSKSFINREKNQVIKKKYPVVTRILLKKRVRVTTRTRL